VQVTDRITGGVLVALGAAAAWFGSRLPAVPGQDIGPAVFPMMIGFGLIACGALIAFGIGQSFEAPEPAEPSGAPRPRLGAIGVIIPPALLLFYVLASETLGFLLTAAIMVLVAGLALGSRLSIAIPVALGAPVLVHLAFAKLLRVPLPEGLIPAPW
jgi:putative tricarboxylic transport membrane protein